MYHRNLIPRWITAKRIIQIKKKQFGVYIFIQAHALFLFLFLILIKRALPRARWRWTAWPAMLRCSGQIYSWTSGLALIPPSTSDRSRGPLCRREDRRAGMQRPVTTLSERMADSTFVCMVWVYVFVFLVCCVYGFICCVPFFLFMYIMFLVILYTQWYSSHLCVVYFCFCSCSCFFSRLYPSWSSENGSFFLNLILQSCGVLPIPLHELRSRVVATPRGGAVFGPF